MKIVWSEQASAQYTKLRAYALAAVGANRESGTTSPQMGAFKDVLQCVDLLAADAQPAELCSIAIDGIEHPYDPAAKIFEASRPHSDADGCRIFWCHGPKDDQITLLTITPRN
jgi:hypothetical protein